MIKITQFKLVMRVKRQDNKIKILKPKHRVSAEDFEYSVTTRTVCIICKENPFQSSVPGIISVKLVF